MCPYFEIYFRRRPGPGVPGVLGPGEVGTVSMLNTDAPEGQRLRIEAKENPEVAAVARLRAKARAAASISPLMILKNISHAWN